MLKISLPLPISLLLLLLLLPAAEAQIGDFGEAINQAGRQRMLSQRILKNHVLAAMDIDALKAQAQKQRDIELFETQLGNLKRFSPDGAVSQALGDVEQLWRAYRRALDNPLQKDDAIGLLEQSNSLLKAAHQVVLLLEQRAPSRSGHWVNIAGRQRMLSQRLTLFHIYRSWGLDSPLLQREPPRNMQEFEQALSEMSAAPVNTDAIRQLLRQGQREWKLFRHGLEGREKDPIVYIVNLAGNQLLETMDQLTRQYARLDRQPDNR
jgi:nitrate/nitrite-specific signal transduction histidine kinase